MGDKNISETYSFDGSLISRQVQEMLLRETSPGSIAVLPKVAEVSDKLTSAGNITRNVYTYENEVSGTFLGNITRTETDYSGVYSTITEITGYSSNGSWCGYKPLELIETRIQGGSFKTRTNFTYDQKGNLRSRTRDSFNTGGKPLTEDYYYDACGNITTSITIGDADCENDIQLRQTEYEYDNLKRFVTKTTDMLGMSEKSTYNPLFGVVLTSTDTRGDITTYEYDNFGNLKKIYLPLGHITTIETKWDVATNWNNLDSFGEGLASFGIGAATGGLTALNPALGAVVGSAFSSAGNDIIKQTGDGIGLSQVEWGSVGTQALWGAFLGGATYGICMGINVNGVANNIINGIGITNNSVKTIVSSSINGIIVGGASGTIRGITTGAMTGQWNIWEHTWKGAAYGGVGGLVFGGLTEVGYQAQLKWGRNSVINSKNTEVISGQGEDYINRHIQVGIEGGQGNMIDGYSGPEIVVDLNTQTNISTVYIRNISPNSYWQPPAPYQYYSHTLYQNIMKVLRLGL